MSGYTGGVIEQDKLPFLFVPDKVKDWNEERRIQALLATSTFVTSFQATISDEEARDQPSNLELKIKSLVEVVIPRFFNLAMCDLAEKAPNVERPTTPLEQVEELR